jgi:endo-1,4-beta-xylanase
MRRRLTAGTVALGLVAGISAVALVAPVATAAEPTTVYSEDFEDGSFAPWTQSGGPTVSVFDADGVRL